MNTIGGYFVNKMEDAVSIKENMVIGKNYRFTFLTDRLVRLEYSPAGKFEDRPTQRVVFRKFPQVNFNVSQTEMLLQIATSYFTLSYVKEKPFTSGKFTPGNNLRIALNNTERIWYYPHPEVRNFGGITYSLDDFTGNLKFEKGLYSTDGFAYIDDSDSEVLDSNGNFLPRDNKELDLYVFMYRKDLGLCLQDYYSLTGYPMLLPRYTLGNWWYKNRKYTNEELNTLVSNFKENQIPISVILLGNKWHAPNDPFQFDNSMIEIDSLKKMLQEHQIKLGLTIEPDKTVPMNTLSYQTISSATGTALNEYNFFPLDTNNLNLYATYGFRNWLEQGIDVLYIDYQNSKDKKSLAKLDHYAYAMYGLLLNKRGAVVSRNHQIAAHRNTIIMTGKTKVDWNTLAILPRYNATASNNGISYVASAIGGYYGGIEDFELYIRYIQLGVFSSMLILASDGGKYYKREPWRWNISQLEMIKKYLKLRYKLIPYLYTESYIYSKNGSPIVQPLYYKYPKIYDEPLYKNQYFFGSKILVCPITKRKNVVMNRVVQRMFIPEGTWYELESGKKYLGNKYYMSFYKDEDYPVFCREGSIIILSLDETTELPKNVEVDVFPGCNGEYQLYEDDGISNNYKNANFAITNYTFQYQPNSYELVIQNLGNPGIIPDTRNYTIRFKNTKMASVLIQSGANQVNGNLYNDKNDLVIEITNVSTSQELKIICSGENIMSSTIRLINDDIRGILEDLEIETILKEKIDKILFGELPIKKKRIEIRKLKRAKLEPKFIKMFLNLLEYVDTV